LSRGVTGRHRESQGVSHRESVTGRHRESHREPQGLTGTHRPQGVTGSQRESQGVTGTHRESKGVTGSHRDSQGLTGHRESQGVTGSHRQLGCVRSGDTNVLSVSNPSGGSCMKFKKIKILIIKLNTLQIIKLNTFL